MAKPCRSRSHRSDGRVRSFSICGSPAAPGAAAEHRRAASRDVDERRLVPGGARRRGGQRRGDECGAHGNAAGCEAPSGTSGEGRIVSPAPGNARVPAAMGEVLGFLLALGITAPAIPVLARVAPGWGLVAQSGPRMQPRGPDARRSAGSRWASPFSPPTRSPASADETSRRCSRPRSPSRSWAACSTTATSCARCPSSASRSPPPRCSRSTGEALLTHLGQLMSPELFTLGPLGRRRSASSRWWA